MYVGIETSSSPANNSTRSPAAPTSDRPASRIRNVPASSHVPPRRSPGPRLAAATNRSPAITSASSSPEASVVQRMNDENPSSVTPAETPVPRPWATSMAVTIAASATSQPERRPANAPPR